tara:strand:+ start:1363 stop:3009 length:1647 start_codon:yes stop_codon:yes gene_type:complete
VSFLKLVEAGEYRPDKSYGIVNLVSPLNRGYGHYVYNNLPLRDDVAIVCTKDNEAEVAACLARITGEYIASVCPESLKRSGNLVAGYKVNTWRDSRAVACTYLIRSLEVQSSKTADTSVLVIARGVLGIPATITPVRAIYGPEGDALEDASVLPELCYRTEKLDVAGEKPANCFTCPHSVGEDKGSSEPCLTTLIPGMVGSEPYTGLVEMEVSKMLEEALPGWARIPASYLLPDSITEFSSALIEDGYVSMGKSSIAKVAGTIRERVESSLASRRQSKMCRTQCPQRADCANLEGHLHLRNNYCKPTQRPFSNSEMLSILEAYVRELPETIPLVAKLAILRSPQVPMSGNYGYTRGYSSIGYLKDRRIKGKVLEPDDRRLEEYLSRTQGLYGVNGGGGRLEEELSGWTAMFGSCSEVPLSRILTGPAYGKGGMPVPDDDFFRLYLQMSGLPLLYQYYSGGGWGWSGSTVTISYSLTPFLDGREWKILMGISGDGTDLGILSRSRSGALVYSNEKKRDLGQWGYRVVSTVLEAAKFSKYLLKELIQKRK